MFEYQVSNAYATKRNCGVRKGGTEETISKVHLPCITVLVYVSPDNDNNTTVEVKLSRARRKIQRISEVHMSYQSCRGWRCSPWLMCSSHQYQPS